MKINKWYILLFLISVMISAVSQVILKKSAGKTYTNKIREYLNIPVIMAYALFFMSSLLTVLAYTQVPLALGPVLETTGYIWVSVLGVLFLKEKIGRRKIIGMIVIIIGIIIFNVR